jgi:hypothetical protein
MENFKNALIGKRVSVEFILRYEWETKKSIKNAILMDITNHGQVAYIITDELTTGDTDKISNGHYYFSSYLVTES